MSVRKIKKEHAKKDEFFCVKNIIKRCFYT